MPIWGCVLDTLHMSDMNYGSENVYWFGLCVRACVIWVLSCISLHVDTPNQPSLCGGDVCECIRPSVCVLFRTIMSKRKGADAANGEAPGKKTKSKAEACDAGRVRFASPGKGARAAEPMPNFVMLKEKYLLTNAYMDMVENAVPNTDPVSPSKKPKKKDLRNPGQPLLLFLRPPHLLARQIGCRRQRPQYAVFCLDRYKQSPSPLIPSFQLWHR